MNNQTLQAISLVCISNNPCEHKRDNFVNIFVILTKEGNRSI